MGSLISHILAILSSLLLHYQNEPIITTMIDHSGINSEQNYQIIYVVLSITIPNNV